MNEEGAGEGRPTPVMIFGRTYHLRGDGDSAYLEQLAREVDRRMREVGESTGTADSLKIAILAALNITDDWFRAGTQGSPADGETEERLARLVASLDEALVDRGAAAPRGVADRASDERWDLRGSDR